MSDGPGTRKDRGRFGPDDAELLSRICSGDASGFHGLVDKYGQYLFGLAVSLVGNRADAEDVLQETYLGAFRGARRFEGRSSVKTWLTGILVRQVAGHRRAGARRKTVSMEFRETVASKEAVRSRAGAVDVQMDVEAAVRSLSEAHREVIVLREFKGLSYDEIAEVLGVPRGTVESRLFRARRELKDILKAYLSDE